MEFEELSSLYESTKRELENSTDVRDRREMRVERWREREGGRGGEERERGGEGGRERNYFLSQHILI